MHLIQGLMEVAQDVEFVAQELGLRGMGGLKGRSAEGFPHIHYRQADSLALLGPQPGIEQIQARFRAILPPAHG
jgi:hypothetical protein